MKLVFILCYLGLVLGGVTKVNAAVRFYRFEVSIIYTGGIFSPLFAIYKKKLGLNI